MTKYLTLPFIAILVSSCISSYQLPEGYTGPTAVIKDTASKTGAIKAEAFQVSKIDGKLDRNSPMATLYGGGMGVILKDSKRIVPAGKPITLTISGGNIYAADGAALFDSMSGNAKKYVQGDVSFTPEPNEVYRVNGVAGKESSCVWIEDESSKKMVTSKVIKN